MEYRKFGSTGLEVSRICLGCMSFGEGDREWTLNEEQSRPFIRRAIEAGVNFFDTANVYSNGSSEEITGRALKDFAAREDVVIATKVYSRMRPGPNGAGLSRKAIMTEIDNSLRRLGTDYVDLYQIHRWDELTPIEETLEALHDVVKAGKARYIGASSMASWQFAQALYTADLNGWTRFSSMQNHYNLIYREEEREMLPLCEDQGIAVIPWSPLARGKLARAASDLSTTRSGSDQFVASLYPQEHADNAVIERVEHVAKQHGVPMARIALAWVLASDVITAPIVGVTKQHHLDDAIAALDVDLGAEQISYLEERYVPHEVAGF